MLKIQVCGLFLYTISSNCIFFIANRVALAGVALAGVASRLTALRVFMLLDTLSITVSETDFNIDRQMIAVRSLMLQC